LNAFVELSGSHGIDGLSPECWGLIDQYRQLLWQWNERMNLTRHTTLDLFVRRDLLDAWKLAKYLQPNEEVLDVGTGGGVPGVLLAIMRPDLQVTLCESIGKKARAVEAMVGSLKLSVPVYPMHVKKVLDEFRYDSLVVRGVGSLTQLCTWLDAYWHSFGRLLAIKGPRWVDERGEARHRGLLKNIELRKLDEYKIPETESESFILQLRRPRPGESSTE
jgi:16S rRNA (guanine527-N7)-methyltransferase